MGALRPLRVVHDTRVSATLRESALHEIRLLQLCKSPAVGEQMLAIR